MIHDASRAMAACLAALPWTFLQAQVNLGFEAAVSPGEPAPKVPSGWQAGDDLTAFELDARTRRSGAHSLRVTAAAERARFSQALDPRSLAGERVRISAYVKTANTQSAGLRVRVEDPTGLIYIDRTRAPATSDPQGWTRVQIQAPVAPTATQLSFGGELHGAGRAWFDDFTVETVDPATLPDPSPVASRYVRHALSIIQDNALSRATLHWPAYRAAVLRQTRGAVTVDDAYLPLRYALGALGDGHSHLMTAEAMRRLIDAPVENARTGRPPVQPRGELLGGTIGYLRLPGFAGGSHMDRVEFAESLHSIIAGIDVSAARGWIVDLRDNSGGNLWPMLAGIGPLLGDGGAGASVGPGGESRSLWYENGRAGLGEYVQLRVRGEPYRLRRAHAPVAVLTNGETASAAEILAAAFAARPRTRTFGEPTRGATTGTRTFPLSDGAALVLAVSNVSDRTGRIHSGPMAPDETVSAREQGLPLTEQPVVRAAQAWLSRQAANARGLPR